MSKIMFNGHSYSGGSINPNLATDVEYNNTASGLSATNVQGAIDEALIKSVLITSSITSSYQDSGTIGYRSTTSDAVVISNIPGFPTGKNVLGYWVEYAYAGNVGEYYNTAIVTLINGYAWASSKLSGTVRFGIRVIYTG